MLQSIKAQVIVLIDNQYYEITPTKFSIVETPLGTMVEIAGKVKDDEWVGYEVNNTK